MAYGYSRTDRKNMNWMKSDNTRGTLCEVVLRRESLRGLNPFRLEFNYPITAIAGENGSGKSTLLAIAACAYHNRPDGYRPADRNNSYYTFSDFFIQSRNEVPPEGIIIEYEFLHNRWRGREAGPGRQWRFKRVGGKWNNYDVRVKRNVIYFGIQRVVPHYERSAHKSYRGRFSIDSLEEQHREDICAIAGRIIGRPYDTLGILRHSKYSLPIATSDGVQYSGFNMGAGESAVFEILSSLFESGEGSLLIIDEIEAGLHEQAQIRLVEELKELCQRLHCQVICSTHSHVVLDALPPEGRFFLESIGGKTLVTEEISADYACGKLRGRNTGELDVFVEDKMAELILQLGMPHRLRQRINIVSVGSANALIRLMASRYLERRNAFLCVLDGDKRKEDAQNKSRVAQYAEKQFRESQEEMNIWVGERLTYLPSDSQPEKWLIQSCSKIKEKTYLVNAWRLDDDQPVTQALERALKSRNHSEFFTLGQEINLPEEDVKSDLIRFLLNSEPHVLNDIVDHIEKRLDSSAAVQ